MSKSFFTSLITALIVIAPAQAQSLSSERHKDSSYAISPRQLISLAQQGQFKNRGIPSHNNFRHGVKTGKITAQSLIESAIASKRLPAEVESDRNYLQTVKNHLKSGGCGS